MACFATTLSRRSPGSCWDFRFASKGGFNQGKKGVHLEQMARRPCEHHSLANVWLQSYVLGGCPRDVIGSRNTCVTEVLPCLRIRLSSFVSVKKCYLFRTSAGPPTRFPTTAPNSMLVFYIGCRCAGILSGILWDSLRDLSAECLFLRLQLPSLAQSHWTPCISSQYLTNGSSLVGWPTGAGSDPVRFSRTLQKERLNSCGRILQSCISPAAMTQATCLKHRGC